MRVRLPRFSARRMVGVAAAAGLPFGACADDDGGGRLDESVESVVREGEEAIGEALDDATEAIIRNIAAQQGGEQFNGAGHPLDDEGLSCEAVVAAGGLDAVAVDCVGRTEQGEVAELTGRTSELPGGSITELEGEFTGTVDGNEVFSVDRLGA